jgi:hypothetical protein
MRGCRAQRRIKGNIVGLFFGGARLDVSATLAVGAGAGVAPGLTARQPVKRRIQAARNVEFIPRLHLLATFPPARVCILKHILRAGLGLANLWGLIKAWRVLL